MRRYGETVLSREAGVRSAQARYSATRRTTRQPNLSSATSRASANALAITIERGAVTGGYRADRETVIRLLNEALATEIVCVLRYKAHYFLASGIHAKSVAAEFLEHAQQEQEHADRIAERIAQLGGEPNLSPESLDETSRPVAPPRQRRSASGSVHTRVTWPWMNSTQSRRRSSALPKNIHCSPTG